MGSYRMILGMFQEDVNWYLKRIDSIVHEYHNEMNPTELSLTILEILRGFLLSKQQLKEKYGIRRNPGVTQIRFREYVLQVLIRLCVIHCSCNNIQISTNKPDPSSHKSSTLFSNQLLIHRDPIPLPELELIISLMKQVTFILDMNEGTQQYFDVGLLLEFHN